MAGDYFQKSTTGQKFGGVPSKLDNTLKDIARAFQADGLLGADGGAGAAPQGLIYVQNNSGSACQRFGVLGISGVLIDDGQNLQEFQNNWALTGETPVASTDRSCFVITWEPIAAGATGRAFITGTCPVQIQMNNAGDLYADIIGGDATKLQSGPSGAAQILYNGSGSTAWAIVRLGNGNQGVIVCALTQTGGSNGTQTAAPTYTYTVKDVYGNTLGTAMAPQVARPDGAVAAASYGLGYFDASGTFRLLEAFEIPSTGSDCT
jgi:hypothetical protein